MQESFDTPKDYTAAPVVAARWNDQQDWFQNFFIPALVIHT